MFSYSFITGSMYRCNAMSQIVKFVCDILVENSDPNFVIVISGSLTSSLTILQAPINIVFGKR